MGGVREVISTTVKQTLPFFPSSTYITHTWTTRKIPEGIKF